MSLTISTILLELRYRLARANEELTESRAFGTSTPGFNQDLGTRDAIRDFLEWLKQENKNV